MRRINETNEYVRIDKVIIERLFGYLDYNINYKNDEHVSIFIAPNGCGKTTIFNILNFMCYPSPERLEIIRGIPFNKFICVLSTGDSIAMEKRPVPLARRDLDPPLPDFDYLFTIYGPNGISYGTVELNSFKRLEKSIKRFYIEGSGAKNRSFAEGEKLIFEDYAQMLCRELRDVLSRANLIRNLMDTLYLTANFEECHTLPDANDYITRQLIQKMRRMYGSRLSKLWDELPYLYLGQDEPTMPESEFCRQWLDYVERLQLIAKIGLIEQVDTLNIENILQRPAEIKAAYARKKAFLYLYLQSARATLFNRELISAYHKLKLFADIFAERNRITQKKLVFTEDGIKVMMHGIEIPLDCLSSGEKHDFLMFFHLIFIADPGNILLIDEPEISLHIEWQERYLDDLLKICEINNLQAIVATHSPSIVNGHFELYAKKEVNNE